MKTIQKIIRIEMILIMVGIAFFLNSCSKEEVSEELSTESPSTDISAAQAVPNSYIIVFKEDEKLKKNKQKVTQKASGILSKYKISSKKMKFVYETAIQGFNLDDISTKEAELLKNDPDILAVEPNYIEKLDVTVEQGVMPSVTTGKANKKVTNGYFETGGDYVDWGVARVGGYTYSTGKTAWILDSGVYAHPDLNIDYNRSTTFVDNNWGDRNGHGTHVAGTIGAMHNGDGVVGVAPGATIVAVKVLSDSGIGTQAQIIAGINYVANNASYGDVWNYSIGFTSRTISVAYETAFRNLAKTTFGAMAAGNNNDDVQYYSPQRAYIQGCWVVGNMTNTDAAAGGSSYGNNVHAWAPGTGIWSCGIGGNEFAQKSGTSMASPHLAGILLVNGNGKIFTDGNVTKRGYTASIAVAKQ
ncbi:S8 family serine peptidase [Aquimarina macrocephali]|uniref:S8 family serine peptidase n=1 Tax=Aquimarina macrocephali TaxID=666563 RepID=UPI0004665377|nr:S8 family serine peptidase [Aquimarina macrocephali]